MGWMGVISLLVLNHQGKPIRKQWHAVLINIIILIRYTNPFKGQASPLCNELYIQL